jgi:hypothetical protein
MAYTWLAPGFARQYYATYPRLKRAHRGRSGRAALRNRPMTIVAPRSQHGRRATTAYTSKDLDTGDSPQSAWGSASLGKTIAKTVAANRGPKEAPPRTAEGRG